MILICIILCLINQTHQWSGDAHRIVASIAYRFLSSTAKDFFAYHLCERDASKVAKSMIDVSIFADSVDWSGELHFSSTPKQNCSPFEQERDCGNNGRCIVTAIANYTSRATDISLSNEQRGEAVKFLVHYVADIHNPMHVGFAEDFGGNLIGLSNPAGKSLHEVWDYDLVNRKQVSLGIHKSQADEGSEPWILSEALLEEISRMKLKSKHYAMDIDSRDVSSLESATKIGARMASETALKYTCNIAYMNERNRWIKSGESLTEEYMNTRAEAAMELIKFAGVRLAELLNTIARVYNHRLWNKNKAEKEALSPNPVSSNQYLVLETIELDLRDLLYDECEGYKSSVEIGKSPRKAPCKKAGKNKKGGKSSSRASKGKLDCESRESASAEIEQEISYMFEGVDLRDAVLLQSKGFYVLTSKKLLNKGRLDGQEYFTFTVIFSGNAQGNQEIDLQLDAQYFNRRLPSSELILRVLMWIQSARSPESLVGTSKLSLAEFQNTVLLKRKQFEVAPFAGVGWNDEQLQQARVVEPLKRAFNGVPNQQERKEICVFVVDRIILFLLRETLEAEAQLKDQVIRTNVYNVVNHERTTPVTELVMLDERLFAGPIPTEFFMFLFRLVDSAATHPLSRKMLRNRPSLMDELNELNIMFFGTNPSRGEWLTAIKWLEEIKADDISYFRLHWSNRLTSDLPDSSNVSPVKNKMRSTIQPLLTSPNQINPDWVPKKTSHSSILKRYVTEAQEAAAMRERQSNLTMAGTAAGAVALGVLAAWWYLH